MKKIIFLILFVPSLSIATNSTAAKSFKRIEIGYSFSPLVTYRLLQENRFGPDSMDAVIQKQILNGRNQREEVAFGFSTGLKVRVNIARFFAVESGIEYNLHRYIYKGEQIYLTTFNGSLPLDTIGLYKANYLYNYHYLKIPLALVFSAGKERFKAIFGFGTGLDVLLKLTQTTTSVMNGNKKTRTDSSREPFVKFNLTPFAGVGFEYEINDRVKVRALPYAQIQALKNIDTPITERLWSAGINISFTYGFWDVQK